MSSEFRGLSNACERFVPSGFSFESVCLVVLESETPNLRRFSKFGGAKAGEPQLGTVVVIYRAIVVNSLLYLSWFSNTLFPMIFLVLPLFSPVLPLSSHLWPQEMIRDTLYKQGYNLCQKVTNFILLHLLFISNLPFC